MKILTNGSSVSCGDDSWPYQLQKQLDCDLINLSLAGAGNNYITDSTIAEISERQYDMVIIMWTDFNRVDFRVQSPAFDFPNVYYTSFEQSKLNVEKKIITDIPPEWGVKLPSWTSRLKLEAIYIQKNWIFGTAYAGKDEYHDNVGKLFSGYYKFTGQNQLLSNSLTRIISLQGVLKSMNIPYLFLNYKPTVGLYRFPHLYNMLDKEYIFDDYHLHSIAVNNKWWDKTTIHPTIEAHKYYANLLVQRIKQDTTNFP